MDSIGRLLCEAREQKGLSIEQVARDTNISASYLTAMESEDMAPFPGETYFLGFLRIYADFLNLDPAKLLNIHRNIKLQEQPTPLDKLIVKPQKTGKGLRVLLGLLLVGGLVYGGYFFYPSINEYFANRKIAQTVAGPGTSGSSEEILFTNDFMTKEIKVNDTLLIPVEEELYHLIVERIRDEIVFSMADSSVSISKGEEKSLDLSGNGIPDVAVRLTSVFEDTNQAQLDVSRITSTQIDPIQTSEGISSIPLSTITRQTTGLVEAGSPLLAQRSSESIIIDNKDQREPFELDLLFSRSCILRYRLNNRENVEKLYQPGERLRLTVDSEIALWISNAGNVEAAVNAASISLGNPGEVSTKVIRWEENTGANGYDLTAIPIY